MKTGRVLLGDRKLDADEPIHLAINLHARHCITDIASLLGINEQERMLQEELELDTYSNSCGMHSSSVAPIVDESGREYHRVIVRIDVDHYRAYPHSILAEEAMHYVDFTMLKDDETPVTIEGDPEEFRLRVVQGMEVIAKLYASWHALSHGESPRQYDVNITTAEKTLEHAYLQLRREMRDAIPKAQEISRQVRVGMRTQDPLAVSHAGLRNFMFDFGAVEACRDVGLLYLEGIYCYQTLAGAPFSEEASLLLHRGYMKLNEGSILAPHGAELKLPHHVYFSHVDAIKHLQSAKEHCVYDLADTASEKAGQMNPQLIRRTFETPLLERVQFLEQYIKS